MDWELFWLLSLYQQNHLHVCFSLDVVVVKDWARLCSFYQIISSDHSKDSIEEKFFSIFPYYSSLQHPHNHSFQIPGNDKRLGMNRKILPQCLLINLTRDQHFHISTYILVFLDIWYWNPELFFMIDSGCIVTPLCQTKNITTFSSFNKVRNASGQEYFLASCLSPSTDTESLSPSLKAIRY